jgi:hypothetical protein
VVVVDQSVQELPATHWPVALRHVALGRLQSESQMGTLGVVMLGASQIDEHVERLIYGPLLPRLIRQ